MIQMIHFISRTITGRSEVYKDYDLLNMRYDIFSGGLLCYQELLSVHHGIIHTVSNRMEAIEAARLLYGSV